MHVYESYHNRCVLQHPKYDYTNPKMPVWRKQTDKDDDDDAYNKESKSCIKMCMLVGMRGKYFLQQFMLFVTH